MDGRIRTAIVVAAPKGSYRQLIHLVSACGLELLAGSDNGRDAMQLLHAHRPDLLVCDAQLPGMDGSTLVHHALCTFTLPVRPAVMLFCHPGYPILHAEALFQAGVLPLEKPANATAFATAIDQLQKAPPAFCTAQLQRVDALLDALGVPAHIGRTCLKYAALICASDERCMHNMRGMLYPRLLRICGLDGPQSERAMRHTIDLAWQSNQFENQYRIFADTVDAGRGQPTCGEMISRLADILRLEG